MSRAESFVNDRRSHGTQAQGGALHKTNKIIRCNFSRWNIFFNTDRISRLYPEIVSKYLWYMAPDRGRTVLFMRSCQHCYHELIKQLTKFFTANLHTYYYVCFIRGEEQLGTRNNKINKIFIEGFGSSATALVPLKAKGSITPYLCAQSTLLIGCWWYRSGAGAGVGIGVEVRV